MKPYFAPESSFLPPDWFDDEYDERDPEEELDFPCPERDGE